MLKIYNFIFFQLSFFAFFPYVSFNILNVDSQPYFFLISFFYFLFEKVNFKSYIYIIFAVLLLLVFSFFDVLGVPNYFLIFRGVINYLTVIFGLLAFCLIYKKISIDYILLLLRFYLFVYLAASLIQLFGISDLTFISPNRGSLAGGRGVSSLAAEPTFYGIIILFLGLYYVLLSKMISKDVPIYIYTLLIFNLVCSMSSTAFIFLFFYICINYFKIKYLFYVLIFIIIIYILLVTGFLSLENTRVGFLLNLFIENGFNFFKIDASANERLSAMIFPYQGFIDNYMFPHFFSSYASYSSYAREVSTFFWYGSGGKIMNYSGSFLFELGIFGFLFIILLFYKVLYSRLISYSNTLLLFLLLNISIPISSGYVCAIFSLFFYYGYNVRTTTEVLS